MWVELNVPLFYRHIQTISKAEINRPMYYKITYHKEENALYIYTYY